MYDSWSSWCNDHVGIKYFLNKLFEKHHHLLDAKHPNWQYNTLAYALVFKQHDFVDVVPQVDVQGFLYQRAGRTIFNCLLLALEHSSPSLPIPTRRCVDYPEIFHEKTPEDNTPVHEIM